MDRANPNIGPGDAKLIAGDTTYLTVADKDGMMVSLIQSNYADLGFALDLGTRRLVVVSALDNLGKGAAGQAVENMNLMYGFPQEMALG